MANIVITTVNANTIKVEFNDYYPTNHDISIAYYNRSNIQKVELKSDRVKVQVLDEGVEWQLSYTTLAGAFTVDEIDGDTTITSNDDLASKIAALIIA